MRDRIHFVYPIIPPTSNKLYIRGTILTPVAREYAERFSQYIVQTHGWEINEMDPQQIYALHLRFYMVGLENPTWNNPNISPSKRAKTRYKRVDLSNRIKLLEDCVRDALDIDDSHTFAASQEKIQVETEDQERVEIIVQRVNRSLFGMRD